MYVYIYPRLPAVRWGKEEKGLDWPFKSHLGSENLACRERKELMSEDGWAARWGLMLMGELKLSTQTLRGQNCRSVFLMLSSPQHQGCKSASSMEGSGGGGKKKDRISSPFPCPLPILLFSPIPLPFPVKFPTSSFSSETETMIAPYGGAGERISSFPSSALGRNGLLGLRGRLSALPLCSLASVRQEAGCWIPGAPRFWRGLHGES